MQWPRQWSALCVAWPCHEGATLLKLFSGTDSRKASIQTTYCFHTAAKVYCCPTKHKIHKTNLTYPKKPAIIFPADSTLLNFFCLGDVMQYHSIDCCLNSCSKFCPKISSCDSLQQETLTSCITPVAMAFLLSSFVCHTCGCQLAQTLTQSNCSVTAITMPLLMDRLKHNLLHDSYHISVHQHSRCHTLLQCKGNHSTDHHTFLLLLFQFLQSTLPTTKQYAHPQLALHSWTNICEYNSVSHLQQLRTLSLFIVLNTHQSSPF